MNTHHTFVSLCAVFTRKRKSKKRHELSPCFARVLHSNEQSTLFHYVCLVREGNEREGNTKKITARKGKEGVEIEVKEKSRAYMKDSGVLDGWFSKLAEGPIRVLL